MNENIPPADQRFKQLQNWVAEQLPEASCLVPLLGDAGGRRYFCINGNNQWLAVDAPPDTEKVAQFLYLADKLRAQRVRVPQVQAADPDRGFLLVENLGTVLLSGEVTEETAPLLYGEALMSLLAMAQTPLSEVDVPTFDRAFILRELEIFREWFVGRLLGVSLTPADNQMLDKLFNLLAERALAQPKVLMHRDYHSRNILMTAGQCAVIDFQDAVIGPLTYDAVSLLKDAYLRLPAADVKRWAQVYGDMARDAGLLSEAQCASFWQDFELMGLQRHLKVLGIFARLHLRDDKPGYLPDMPRVLGYVLEVCSAYPDLLGQLENWLVARILPRCENQDWYKKEALYPTHYPQAATLPGGEA